MSKKSLFLALILILIPLLLGIPSFSSKKIDGESLAPKLVKKLKRRPAEHLFKKIESPLENSRLQLAACFWKEDQSSVVDAQLSLHWNASGRLTKLSSQPLLEDTIRLCLQNLIRAWRLPSHPALQPYSYEFDLSL